MHRNSAARHLETDPKRIKEHLRWKNELQFVCASILRSLICFLDLRLIFKIQIPNFDWDSLFFSNIVCRTELIKIQIHFSKMVYNRKDASLELSRGNVLPRLPPNLRTTIWTSPDGRGLFLIFQGCPWANVTSFPIVFIIEIMYNLLKRIFRKSQNFKFNWHLCFKENV